MPVYMGSLLRAFETTKQRHRPGCTGHPRRLPAEVAKVAVLVERLIELRERCDPKVAVPCYEAVALGRCAFLTCLACDLDHVEGVLYQLRGGDYSVPDCCATARAERLNRPTTFRQGVQDLRWRLNLVAARWGLPAPFPDHQPTQVNHYRQTLVRRVVTALAAPPAVLPVHAG